MGKKNTGDKVKQVVEETGDKMKDVVEETIDQVDSHRVRSLLLGLLAVALTVGIWYLVSERD
jgi:hypothetical protein